MKITKLGHCCLLIEVKGLRILTDPGKFSENQNSLKGIDVILLTHEHQDHFHSESIRAVMDNNPEARIITNPSVEKILETLGLKAEVVAHADSILVKEVSIEGFGREHANIYKTILPVENTGYFIDHKLFYPGDAFFNPEKEVDILALPVAGPWLKISDAIEYALLLKPRIAFPVHDGMIKKYLASGFHRLPSEILPQNNIEFISMSEGDSKEF